jgi:hypothetical protein
MRLLLRQYIVMPVLLVSMLKKHTLSFWKNLYNLRSAWMPSSAKLLIKNKSILVSYRSHSFNVKCISAFLLIQRENADNS